ncbi:MAG: hypothetical protein NE330_22060 [Lentisphaeraceae bacterium]|nr:hypothetical protein [Lentisphaeraceae bacterium]
MNTIETFKSYPKNERNILWTQAVKSIKKENPKAFFKAGISSGIGGSSGTLLGILAKNQTEHWIGFVYLLLISGLCGAIGGCVSSKKLEKELIPYLQKLIEEKKKQDEQ